MAPRNDTKEATNGLEEPQPETGYATLATLRYEMQSEHESMISTILEYLADDSAQGWRQSYG